MPCEHSLTLDCSQGSKSLSFTNAHLGLSTFLVAGATAVYCSRSFIIKLRNPEVIMYTSSSKGNLSNRRELDSPKNLRAKRRDGAS